MIWHPLNGSSPLKVNAVLKDLQLFLEKLQFFDFLINIQEYAVRQISILVVSLVVQCIPFNMTPSLFVYLKKWLSYGHLNKTGVVF